ncbi:H-type lectin domain-containing protein [Limimaricola sp.]|uniref:H-type lectin domain-containing protein n=1 Tax=Limimaricola sp. TaxID=2211665 RepID=UPI004058A78E
MARYVQSGFGIDQGELVPFEDFQTDGPMWTGSGAREVRRRVYFNVAFSQPPLVQLGVTMWDVSNDAPMRLDVRAEEIDRAGFILRTHTWSDSRIARVRVAWTAFGACYDDERWDID